MIVSAAIVPHTPLLAPSIGKEHREKLAATLKAFTEIDIVVKFFPGCVFPIQF